MTADGWEGDSTPLSEAKKAQSGSGGGDPRDRPVPTAEDCPVTPLGKRGMTFFYFQSDGELVELSAGAHNRRNIKGLFCGDLRWCKEFFPSFDQDGRARPGSWSDDGSGTWLMQECGRKGIFDLSAPVRGPGIWRDSVHGLIVHSGNRLDAIEAGESWPAGQRIGGILYPAAPPIGRPADHAATPAAGADILKALRLWNFKDPLSAELMLGLIGAAMLGGASDWRPHVLVKAVNGSGKTWLAEFVHAALGAGAHPMHNNYTEPGLRQALTRTALALVLDEAEEAGGESRVRAVIEMMRHMSSGEGARAVRGSQGGQSLSYQVTGCVYLSAILPPELEPQDRSRILVVQLGELPIDADSAARRDRVQRAKAWAHEMSPRLRARALQRFGLYGECAEIYRAALLREGCSMRQADQLGALLAGRDMMLQDAPPSHDSADTEVERVAHLVEAYKQDSDDGEGEQCLNHLLSTPGDHWRSGDRRTIGELIMTVTGDRPGAGDDGRALQRIGLRVERAQPGAPFTMVVANKHVGMTKVFTGTRWEGGSWSTALGYLAGAQPHGPTRFAGALARGIALPERWLPQYAWTPPDVPDQAADELAGE